MKKNQFDMGSVIRKCLLYFSALLLFLVYAIPIALVIVNSVKPEGQSKIIDLSLPSKFMYENYWTVLIKGDILRAFLNDLFLATVVTSVTLLLSSIAAFVIQRRKTTFSHITYKYLLAGMIAPFSYIPSIKVLLSLHMYNNYSGIIMVLIASYIPFTVLLFFGSVKSIPKEIDEAAIIDGCGPLKLFFTVIFPMLKPVISTNIILIFSGVWNEFTMVLFLVPSSKMWTLPMTAFNFMGKYTSNYGLICADIMIALIPVVIVFISSQKYIVDGMTAGAVKG